MENVERLNRRKFLGLSTMSVVASQFGIFDQAKAQSSLNSLNDKKQISSPHSFRQVKQINAGVLNIGYAEEGPSDGKPVVLLHGWPYDIHTYTEVAINLAAKGYRVIVPYLRGYGTTRFLSEQTVRNGQQAALAVDIIALMDALKIEKAIIGGCDWGARTANILAALWPQRFIALVSVSGYLIGSQEKNKSPLSPKAEQSWWYQYYFATERGRMGYEVNRKEFAKLIWETASPEWKFTDQVFEQSATAFE
ncbi:MAG: alpha/beta hydrolase, partial [Chitinophagaceae bacterium]